MFETPIKLSKLFYNSYCSIKMSSEQRKKFLLYYNTNSNDCKSDANSVEYQLKSDCFVIDQPLNRPLYYNTHTFNNRLIMNNLFINEKTPRIRRIRGVYRFKKTRLAVSFM